MIAFPALSFVFGILFMKLSSGNVSMGGMHCWNHVPECMNAIFFKNWIVSLFGEMVEVIFFHMRLRVHVLCHN